MAPRRPLHTASRQGVSAVCAARNQSLESLETNIKQILTNEKYIGDALLQKTYTVSVLDKKRSVNDGAMPKYYVEGCHEAIIDRETFLLVQEEIARRSSLYKGGKKRMYSSKYALSGNVVKLSGDGFNSHF